MGDSSLAAASSTRLERNCFFPKIGAWQSRAGLIEEYEYPRGRAGAMPVHAHREMQICLSLDFPGRYAYRGRLHEVPAGAVSVLDSWEPHAASDPCDRDRLSHYIVLYADPDEFRRAIDLHPRASSGDPIRTDADLVHRFSALYRALSSGDSILEQDECYSAFAAAVMIAGDRAPSEPAAAPLLRARDYIAAHAADRITLRDAAAEADLSPWHFARAFRRRFGVPPHRFQLWMRIDLARRLLADGEPSSVVAHRTGFADQSHFTRCFKRIADTTPARYRPLVGEALDGFLPRYHHRLQED